MSGAKLAKLLCQGRVATLNPLRLACLNGNWQNVCALAANLAMDHLDGPQISPFAKFCGYLFCPTGCTRTKQVTVSRLPSRQDSLRK